MNKHLTLALLAATAISGYSTSAMAVVDFQVQYLSPPYVVQPSLQPATGLGAGSWSNWYTYPYEGQPGTQNYLTVNTDTTDFYQSDYYNDTIKSVNSQGQTGPTGYTINGQYDSFHIYQVGGSYNYSIVEQAPGAETDNETITENVNGWANGVYHGLNGNSNGGQQSVTINGNSDWAAINDGGSLGWAYSGTGNQMAASENGSNDSVTLTTEPGNYDNLSATINGSNDTIAMNANELSSVNDHNRLTGTINGNNDSMQLSTYGSGNIVTGQIGSPYSPAYQDTMVIAANGTNNSVSGAQSGNYNYMTLTTDPGTANNIVNASQSGGDYMYVTVAGSNNNLTLAQAPGKSMDGGSGSQPYVIRASGWTATLKQ